jgi:hypothetical protein
MPQGRPAPAEEFDFERELNKLFGTPGPARAEDFMEGEPGFIGRAINEVLPDFLTAGRTAARLPLDLYQGVQEARKSPLGPMPALSLMMAKGLIGSGQDVWTLLKSLGAGAEALSGGNPEIPEGVPEAGGRMLGGLAMGGAGKVVLPRIPGAGRLQGAISERFANKPGRSAAPAMTEAEAIQMLLGDEQAGRMLPGAEPPAATVGMPADLGFRVPAGPGETVLRALLPERFQTPIQVPLRGDASLLDPRVSGLPPAQRPLGGFRPRGLDPDEAAYQRILQNKGGKPRPKEASRKGKFE